MTGNKRDHMAYLKKVGTLPDEEVDLAHTALVLAALDRPGVALQKYHHHLEILGLDLANDGHAAQTAGERAEALSEVLWRRHNYEGNEKFYDDLQNANLMSVIDRRLGIPVTLGILYIHAARSRGWQAEGVNFPGHFLVRVYGLNDQAILDPFHGGRLLTARDLRAMIRAVGGEKAELEPAYYAAVENRRVLTRMLNNIKIRCLQISDLTMACDILERMCLIDPEKIEHTYELGILQAYQGELEKSRHILRICLDRLQDRPDGDKMKKHVLETLRDISRAHKPDIVALVSNDHEKE
ncbi:SirB1 family protein [Luteithermobacter gelatinilyticus]|uniref:SirB1 family protein n=1 Tax=Luteithermobacter gelatinilyticus TaxID=2582913 RepID=UPI0011060693|nr:transglutaminase-like domain-containing protein [Luteithermobacter gelatinilyticus]|tara:strand:+ start:427 stop:1314 length:888 start_codon:yes stop_codon:yes gene_type:complete